MITSPRRPILVAFSTNDWDGAWMNRQQLLSRLGARGWNVFYSQGAFRSWERNTPAFDSAPLQVSVTRTDHVWQVAPGKFLPTWDRSTAITRLAVRMHVRAIQRFIRRVAAGAPVLAHVFHPAFESYAELLKPDALVYHPFDAFSKTDDWTEALRAMEQRLTERADLVVAPSTMVVQSLAAPPRSTPVILPNGADFPAFNGAIGAPAPSDLAAIPHPRVGYVGRITTKVDMAVLGALARRMPDVHFVMVGPVIGFGKNAPRHADLAAATGLRNVHFLGDKPVTDLPSYTANLDAGLLLYRTDPGWWIGASPLKLYEYLAAGIPTISSNSRFELPADHLIPIAESLEDWETLIRSAVSHDDDFERHRRIACARGNSWDVRAEELEAHLLRIGMPNDP